jgi:hypothetical protein
MDTDAAPLRHCAASIVSGAVSVIRRLLFACAVLLAVAGASAVRAQTTEVAGIKYDREVQLAGSRPQLNGAGIRYKAIFKVYTAGLYLGGKAATPEAVIAAPGAKRMHIVMLREIDANELGKLFTRGMQDNSTREDFAKSIAGTIRLGEMFAARKKLAAGDNFFVDYVPGAGTTILINGKAQNDPIKEPEFFNALLRIWLGQSPADAQLKDALLGKAGAETRDPFRN